MIYRLAGLRIGSWLGSLLGSALGKLASERKIAAQNLRLAMPHLSDEERAGILKRCWAQLGRSSKISCKQLVSPSTPT